MALDGMLFAIMVDDPKLDLSTGHALSSMRDMEMHEDSLMVFSEGTSEDGSGGLMSTRVSYLGTGEQLQFSYMGTGEHARQLLGDR